MTQLVAFAEHEFRLGKRDKDGRTLRETLATVTRMTGRTPADAINPIELPPQVEHLWHWFLRLNNKRQQGYHSAAPLSEADIGWFFHSRRIVLAGWELDAIDALDAVALNS